MIQILNPLQNYTNFNQGKSHCKCTIIPVILIHYKLQTVESVIMLKTSVGTFEIEKNNSKTLFIYVIKRISHCLGLDRIFIQLNECFQFPHQGSGIEITQLVRYKSYPTPTYMHLLNKSNSELVIRGQCIPTGRKHR